jgi:large subunit ribosomal protein L25
VIYGGKGEAVSIQLERKEVSKALRSGKFISHLIEINDGGKKQQVIPRAIQFHPVSDEPIHVDLYRVDENTVINVDVPVHFKNHEASPGLKRGGVLNIVQHTVSVATPATRIPEEFIVDLTGLEIGAVLHVSALQMPEGVTSRVRDRDPTIATIVGRLAEEEAPKVEAAAEAAPAADAKAGDAKAAPAAKAGDKK